MGERGKALSEGDSDVGARDVKSNISSSTLAPARPWGLDCNGQNSQVLIEIIGLYCNISL